MTIDRAAVGSLGIIGFILNVVIWALVLVLTLDNLGVDMTALVAGLGIGATEVIRRLARAAQSRFVSGVSVGSCAPSCGTDGQCG